MAKAVFVLHDDSEQEVEVARFESLMRAAVRNNVDGIAGDCGGGLTCATCHGLAGDGQSMVAVNMALMPPPSFQSEKLRAQPDGYFYEVISHGYGVMPPFGWRMTPTERWAVVAYVRALQYSQAVPLAEAPSEVRARLLREGQ